MKLMRRISRFRLFLKKKFRKKPQNGEMRFAEKIARNLDRISFFVPWALFLAFFVSLLIFLETPSEKVMIWTNSAFILLSGILTISYLVFFGVYVEPKILTKTEKLSTFSRFIILRVHNSQAIIGVFLVVIGILVSVCWSLITRIFYILPVTFEFQLSRFFGAFSYSLIGLGLLFMIFYVSLKTSKEIELSFSAIADYENIAQELSRPKSYVTVPPIYPCVVWNFCMKQIVFKLEDRVKRHIGVSKKFSSEFYEPFNIVSFAAIVGNNKQKEKAKDWIVELGLIATEKRIAPANKIKFIVDHLEKIEDEKDFDDFRNIHDSFGFHYDFEHDEKRVFRLISKVVGTFTSIGQLIPSR